MEAFDNPDVKNVTCYVEPAKPGVLRGIGSGGRYLRCGFLSASGPIELSDRIKNGKAQGEVVFKKRTSLV
ncbi:CreA family protein [Escherichia coli]